MKTGLMFTAAAAALALAACSQTTKTTEVTTDPMANGHGNGDRRLPPIRWPMVPTNMAGSNPMVGGAAMMADQTIVANASNAPNLTTLVSAVKQAGLVDTLSGTGPFTVFAPTNDAFGKVDKATLDGLMKPDWQGLA